MIGYRCKECIWFDCGHESIKELKQLTFGKYKVGYCRKHKPVVYEVLKQYWGGWPLVDDNDLCGEFRKES